MEIQWALKDPDMDVYYAEEQYGPAGSPTISSKRGSSQYHPLKFRSKKAAEDFLRKRIANDRVARKCKWKIVRI